MKLRHHICYYYCYYCLAGLVYDTWSPSRFINMKSLWQLNEEALDSVIAVNVKHLKDKQQNLTVVAGIRQTCNGTKIPPLCVSTTHWIHTHITEHTPHRPRAITDRQSTLSKLQSSSSYFDHLNLMHTFWHLHSTLPLSLTDWLSMV